MPAYKDGNTWRCTFYYDSLKERKKKNKRGFKTKKEALEWEREFILKNQGSEDMRFYSLAEIYIKECKVRFRINTWKNKEHSLKKWLLPYFKDMRISDISSKEIRSWQNDIMQHKLKASSIKTINSQLKMIFKFAQDYLGVARNPVGEIPLTGKAKEKIFITEQQFKVLLKAEKRDIYKHAMTILFWTGIRAGELFALTFDDVDIEKKTLKINKSLVYRFKEKTVSNTKTLKGTREIYINKETTKAFLELKKMLYNQEGRIFESISSSSFFYHVRKLGKDCGIEKMGIHTFRHSHATYLFSKKVNVLAISRRLGHANVSTTLNTYTHFMEEMEKEIISAID